jgi:hypothetical protein
MSSWSWRVRVAIGIFLAAAAAIELATALWVVLVGPFRLQLGPIPILGTNPIRVTTVGVLGACAALWLLEPSVSAAARSRIATVCSWIAVAIVVLSGAVLIGPILARGFLHGHDASIHGSFIFQFDRAFQRGQLPVRWIDGFQHGQGQPLFNHYQVGFYYIVELIHSIGPSLSLSFKLAVAAVWMLGAVFMFLWSRPRGVLPAALAASVFAWSPYVLLDGYVRTAYPEFTALAFAPGILWSIDRTFRTGRPIFVCTLALTVTVMLISHLPTTLIMAPVCAAFAIAWWVASGSARRAGAVASGTALGTAMAAFYVFPAILELDYIKISELTTSYFDFRRHFVDPRWWLELGWSYNSSGIEGEHMSLLLGGIQWALLVTAAAILAWPRARRMAGTRRWALAGWLGVAGAALFMTTAASVRIWEAIGPLAFLQFPWRLLMLPALASGALAAVLLAMVRSRTTQALIVIGVATIQWYAMRHAVEMASSNPRLEIAIDDPAWPSTANAREYGFREVGYDPAGVVGAPQPTAAPWTVADGRADIIADAAEDTKLALSVRAHEPVRLTINSPFFPGWTIAVDGRRVTPAIQPKSAFMELLVPSGSHRVEATFRNTPLRGLANLITVSGLAAWAILAHWIARHRMKRTTPLVAAANEKDEKEQ